MLIHIRGDNSTAVVRNIDKLVDMFGVYYSKGHWCEWINGFVQTMGIA